MTTSAVLLSFYGFCVPDSYLRSLFGKTYSQVMDTMVLIHERKQGMPLKIKQYNYVRIGAINYVVMPRTFIDRFAQLGLPIINRLDAGNTIDCELAGTMFDNQRVLIDHLITNYITADRCIRGSSCALINVRAGSGKSFIAAGFIAQMKLRTLWVTINKELANQAKDDLRVLRRSRSTANSANNNGDDNSGDNDDSDADSTVDDRPLYISKFGKTTKKASRELIAQFGDEQPAITIILIQSAIKQNAAFFAQFSCVVFDEVHTLCTDVRKEIFRKASASVMLGMSATTNDRKDGFDKIAHDELAFGGVIHAESVPGFDYGEVNFKSSVKVIHYNGPTDYTQALVLEKTGKLFTPYMHRQAVMDPWRMYLTACEIADLYNWDSSIDSPKSVIRHHTIFVYCEMREPLKTMRDILTQMGVPASDIGLFIGGTSAEESTEMKKNARILLTTYAYTAVGVSIQKATAMVFLTSRRSGMQQILGRILRRGSDMTIERKVVDIVDNRTPMRGQLGERILGYQHYNMKRKHSKVSYEDIKVPDAIRGIVVAQKIEIQTQILTSGDRAIC